MIAVCGSFCSPDVVLKVLCKLWMDPFQARNNYYQGLEQFTIVPVGTIISL